MFVLNCTVEVLYVSNNGWSGLEDFQSFHPVSKGIMWQTQPTKPPMGWFIYTQPVSGRSLGIESTWFWNLTAQKIPHSPENQKHPKTWLEAPLRISITRDDRKQVLNTAGQIGGYFQQKAGATWAL